MNHLALLYIVIWSNLLGASKFSEECPLPDDYWDNPIASLTYSIVTVTKVTLVADLPYREVFRHIYINKVTYYNIDRSLDATYYLTVSAVWLMLVIPYRLVRTPWVRSSTFPSSTLIGTSPRQRHLSADMLISPHLVPIRFTTRSDSVVTVLGFNLYN